MPVWIIKAIVQKLVSFLPYRHRINYLFQKYITKGVKLSDEYMLDRLIHFKNHYQNLEKYRGIKQEIKLVELGTGWYPVIPLCFYLSGVSRIYSFDIASLVSEKNLKLTISKLLDYHKSGKLIEYVENIDEKRIEYLKGILLNESNSKESILTGLNISLETKDARNTGIQDSCIDFITSNNTFEHIYPAVLNDLLAEFKRILKPEGIMSHFIDMSDHFAHLDKSITVFNFLKFSDSKWKRIDNTVQPQNRLRIIQYRELFNTNKLAILFEKNRNGNKQELRSFQLDEQYEKMDIEDVLVTHSHLVLKKRHND